MTRDKEHTLEAATLGTERSSTFARRMRRARPMRFFRRYGMRIRVGLEILIIVAIFVLVWQALN